MTSDPEGVADLIVAALPAMAPTFDDPAYVAWFGGLMEKVQLTRAPPIAYAEYFDDTDGWEVGWGAGIRHPHPPDSRSGTRAP